MKAEEMPGILEACLVKLRKGTCPISIINITEEQVVILTPLVTIEELPEDASNAT